MALFLFTKNILAGKPIDIFNYGKHRRDFTYIDDIVEGIVRVLDRSATPNETWSGDEPDAGTSYAPYRLYNIGNNQPVELTHYIALLEHCLGRKAAGNLLPLQKGDAPDTSADVEDLVRDAGYKPATPVETGIKRFVDWYLQYYEAPSTICSRPVPSRPRLKFSQLGRNLAKDLLPDTRGIGAGARGSSGNGAGCTC